MPHADNFNSDLRLPRILCLHGGGTNARIFRAQCRALEAHLKTCFRLCYAEAPFSSEAGPDVLSVYRKSGPFKRWFRWRPDQPYISSREATDAIRNSLQTAILADNAKGGTGEWVGLLGFSQGAKLAASLLLQQQIQNELGGVTKTSIEGPRFRFAVLFAGRAPLVALNPELEHFPGMIAPSQLTINVDQHLIKMEDCPVQLRIPTIHVHGMRDHGLPWHRQLLEHYCERGSATVICWDGEHRLPIKSDDVLPIVNTIISFAEGGSAKGL